MNEDFWLKIEFKDEESDYFPEALHLMREFSGYNFNSVLDQYSIHTGYSELKSKLKEVDRLVSLIKDWDSVKYEVNGKKTEYDEILYLLRMIRCGIFREMGTMGKKFCENGTEWNCRLLENIKLTPVNKIYHNPENRKYWFDFGYFEDEENWIIDKKEIIREIKEEIETRKIYMCEYFSMNETLKIIKENIPGNVRIKSGEWDIRYDKTTDGMEEVEANGIKPKRKFTSYYQKTNESKAGNILPETENEEKNIPKVSFGDIGGIDEVIYTIREVIELPLNRPELFDYLGITPHKGILLYGPPGCGKTMIAKAIANEINAHFIPIKGPELLNKYLGQSEANLRKIFEEARDKQPSIIFFDEIDAIARKRSSEESLRSESRFVTQLLSLMDGISDFGHVCVIASTNRQDFLDKALLRPGRFDYTIYIDKPTKEGCYDIFRIKTGKMPIDREIDISLFCERLFGLTGAEIDFVVREAAYNCLRRNIDLEKCLSMKQGYEIDYRRMVINMEDFNKSLKKVRTMGN